MFAFTVSCVGVEIRKLELQTITQAQRMIMKDDEYLHWKNEHAKIKMKPCHTVRRLGWQRRRWNMVRKNRLQRPFSQSFTWHLYGGLFCHSNSSKMLSAMKQFYMSLHEENKELSKAGQFWQDQRAQKRFVSSCYTLYIAPVTLQPNFQFVKMAVCHVPACS